ncbi:PhnD/SsuA/transferrin family substrate-binding protein [Leptolyngbya sp. O-77]|uniref:PhnD/SsuA/transferrin family substrate-binding protein n=1 Tax=Leptolyngbya sp. O-77 TaxID=1080068 RepID=UPI00074D30E0|nr:PhnD/SsuA/transferrin family substrate-binding protein [Leptolyngbya sp. O-77]BAU41331.1 ABC transporter, phosphonate, periplasmic substrate-binding protein [Leptolyngbya sp. O-77]
MADNTLPVMAEIAAYAERRLGLPTEFIDQIPWQQREERFDRGEIQVCWICGVPYVQKADQPDPQIELLAAPVMRGDRYQNRPIYFSDVVVQRESPFQRFMDLRGTRWAYNEPRSHSGYFLTRYHLAMLEESRGFFGSVVESGAHQTSLQQVLSGEVDASAIDSTVLEHALREDPSLQRQIRIIDTLGPSPSPPWLVSMAVPTSIRTRLRSLLVQMADDPEGEEILARGSLARFVLVGDRDYDPIRHMQQIAAAVSLAGPTS